MFKPSQPMMARLRLTTKQVNGGYYKGTRTGSMGFFAKPGSYVIDWKKVRTYVVPEDLDQFKLTPFVTKRMAPTKSIYTKTIDKHGKAASAEKGFGGEDYLQYWASANVQEGLRLERKERKARARETIAAQRAAKEQRKAAKEQRKAAKAQKASGTESTSQE